jgi:hypothetical protein
MRYRAARLRDPAYRDVIAERDCHWFWGDPNPQAVHREGSSPSEPGAWVTGFAGVQKVMGSDGSFSLAAAVVDRRFRLDAAFTQYYETEMTGDRITMMAPELSAGVHLGGDASTRVWLESGVMYLKTSDPAGGSTVAGPTFGARFEHQMSPDLAMAGTVEGAYLQDGVRGLSTRVGVRFHHLEAAVRVLALNVGPALYGPEVGVGF